MLSLQKRVVGHRRRSLGDDSVESLMMVNNAIVRERLAAKRAEDAENGVIPRTQTKGMSTANIQTSIMSLHAGDGNEAAGVTLEIGQPLTVLMWNAQSASRSEGHHCHVVSRKRNRHQYWLTRDIDGARIELDVVTDKYILVAWARREGR